MIDEDTWRQLERTVRVPKSTGMAWQRVYPRSPVDLFIVVRQQSELRSLWVDFDDQYEFAANAVALRTIRITDFSLPQAPPRRRIEIQLQGTELTDVFSALANDIFGALGTASSQQDAIELLHQRLLRWQKLLESGGREGLSLIEQRGLVGELTILRELISAGLDPGNALDGWTGPLHAHQDFQFNEGAIEVKASTTKQPEALVINSERELDATGISDLFLAHVSLDERSTGAGMTLPELIGEIVLRLSTSSERERFAVLLATAGYVEAQQSLYTVRRWSIREVTRYHVAPNFPCITEASVPTGVGDITYRLQVGALKPFRCEAAEMWTQLGIADV